MKKLFALIVVVLLFAVSCNYENGAFSPMDYGAFSVNGDRYQDFEENPFVEVSEEPVSTFSVDADGASYANIRRFLTEDNMLPPKGAIRIEEMMNYFDMNYPFSGTGESIALNGELSSCPWNETHRLIRIGIQGEPIPANEMPPSNFVFLIDVSGSMSSDDKLDLLKEGFEDLVDQMRDEDMISIVTYAGASKVLLQPTSASEDRKIKKAIRKLGSGGSTAGAEGIITAYELAEENFISGGNNRVFVGTDGDFNVGISDRDELIKLIEEKRESGIFLTVLGVGRGNLNDAMLEQLANHGNGTYEYIDNLNQLNKVFVLEAARFFTVAKDVKVQVEFSEETVNAYRLIGYENRILETEDFVNDSTDAGEIGSDQSITALYEIIPVSQTVSPKEILNIDFRYKAPDSDVSRPLSLSLIDLGNSFEQSSEAMRFTASVAAFGMLLRDSEYKGDASYDSILTWSKGAMSHDPGGYRAEFREMVGFAKGM